MREDRRQSGQKAGTAKTVKAAAGRLSELDGVRRDYSVYRLSVKEKITCLGQYVLLDACISYLFFCSWIAFVLLLPGIFLFFRERREAFLKKRREEMKLQFQDGIQMMASSLQAGYSAENALREARKEMQKVYEDDSFIVREFRLMEIQMNMSRNLEDLFLDLARRSAVDDMQSFAEVFLTAKRTGGDLLCVIRNTVSCIRQKQETMQEIETCLAGKMMEQKIMSVIPLAILAYIKLTSPEFVETLYGNLTGTVVMGVCFLVYAGAYFWGKRIVQIEV